ncbi:hypothetical protein F5Y16DRAFT_356051 [Xylariaceae sp. FL0255]|nr:hypothetical protein F5Y16DRAFT_356051 [Xylariaceae sp. FL0255]
MEPHNPKKLRSSCDRCALLKVRCTKQRPNCDRCCKAGEKCVYTPYRWKGRPGRLASSTEPLIISDSSVESLYTTNPNFSLTQPGISLEAFHIPSHAQLQLNDHGWEALETHGGDNLMSVFGEDIRALASASQQTDSPASTTVVPTSNGPSSMDGSRDNPPRFQTSLASSSMLNLEGYECHDIILGLLEEIHKTNSQCASFPPTSISPEKYSIRRSSNLIMKSNRAVLQHVDLLLARSCRDTCLKKFSFICLIRAICAAILELYDDVLQSLLRSHRSEETIGSSQVKNTVVFDPVQLTDFPLGRSAEIRLNAELLLCELDAFTSMMTKLGEALVETGMNRIDGGVEDGGEEAKRGSAKPTIDRYLEKRVDSLRKSLATDFKETPL